jgi:hypothetical protein
MRFIVERVSSVWLAWLDTRERWMTDRVSGFGTPLCSYTCRRVDCRRKEPQLVSCLLLFTQSATRQARVLDYCIQKEVWQLAESGRVPQSKTLRQRDTAKCTPYDPVRARPRVSEASSSFSKLCCYEDVTWQRISSVGGVLIGYCSGVPL